MSTSPDYYEVLQVSPNADAEIIQITYRRLALKTHPDKNPGDQAAAERMRLLNEAYEVLSDPLKRHDYDETRKQSLKAAGVRSQPPHEESNPRTDRTAAGRNPSTSSSHTDGPGLKPRSGSSRWCTKKEALWIFVIMIGILCGGATGLIPWDFIAALPFYALFLLMVAGIVYCGDKFNDWLTGKGR
jgi:curved DNA-binding protein CbpA